MSGSHLRGGRGECGRSLLYEHGNTGLRKNGLWGRIVGEATAHCENIRP